jgi:hypothetical protein
MGDQQKERAGGRLFQYLQERILRRSTHVVGCVDNRDARAAFGGVAGEEAV